MSSALYRWKKGARGKAGVDVQKAGERLRQIRRKKRRMVQADDVLEDATDEKSPLHDHFEWDDSAAAHQHRLEQARELIRSIVVVMPSNTEDGEEEEVKAFFHFAGEGYEDTVYALGNPDLREKLLAQAWRELEVWQQRYAQYQELAGVAKAIEKEKAKKKRSRKKSDSGSRPRA